MTVAMSYLICPDCAYATNDGNKKVCEYCRTELLYQCPICSSPIQEDKAIYCRECGVKLRMSMTPIQ
jgi:hypothetical protein